MSNFKRAMPTRTASPRLLDSLKAAQVVTSKPILPAELMAAVLDHLAVSDMLRLAQVSRLMREMVYDDTRWVRRLKSMGCWNESEARQRFEEGMARKLESQKARSGAPNSSSLTSPGRPGHGSETLFDAGLEEQRKIAPIPPPPGRQHTRKLSRSQEAVDSGFKEPALFSEATPIITPGQIPARDPMSTLNVFSKVRSIRGAARQEYGKVYQALAPYYYDLTNRDDHSQALLFSTFREPEQQAQMLAELRRFSHSDWAQGCVEREQKLESVSGVFENAALREFEQGLQSQDIGGRMRKYAHVLVTLNGGTAGVDMFIQRNPLMLRRSTLGDPLDCFSSTTSYNFRIGPAEYYFKELAKMLNEQVLIIDQVFPASIDVLRPFVSRICEDFVAGYVTVLLDATHERNMEAYLKAAAGLYAQCLRFAMSIHSPKGIKQGFTADIKGYIARCFEPHIDLYLQEELDFFRKNSEADVEAWERRLSAEEASKESFYMANFNRQADKRDFLTSFRKVIMMPVNVVGAIPTAFTSAAPSATMIKEKQSSGYSGDSLTPRSSTPVPSERSSTPNPEAPTTELAAKAALMSSKLEGIRTLFSIEIALNLVHAAKASLERATLFVKLGDKAGEAAREQGEMIFVVLLQILGTRHIKTGFDKAVQHLSNYNPREISEHGTAGVEPLVTFLELVNVGDLIQQMVDVFYAQELVAARLSDRDDFLSPAVKEKKRFEQMLDERVAAGLNKGIDVLMDEVEYICATTQQATDYNPPVATPGTAEYQLPDLEPTTTAKRVVELVSSHVGMLVGSTEKQMLEVFNQEVGVRLFSAICKHLKRQRVSVDGAIKLISDTNQYYAYIITLHNKALTQYFGALREIAQIYLIDGAHAKEIGTIIADTERYRGIFEAQEVYEFAERRADWYNVKGYVEKAMYGMGCSAM